jgi:hypothetical protein
VVVTHFHQAIAGVGLHRGVPGSGAAVAGAASGAGAAA